MVVRLEVCPAQPPLACAEHPGRLGSTEAAGETPYTPNESSPELLPGPAEDRYWAQWALLQGRGEEKRKERRKSNATLFIDHFLIKSLNRTLKLDNGHFIRRQTHGTKPEKP